MPEFRRYLLVEGPNDQQVVYHLCNQHAIDNRQWFKVKPLGGYQAIRENLIIRMKADIDAIGVIVDANLDPRTRWQSLGDALRTGGFQTVPEKPSTSGTILEAAGQPRIGIWMMPDNTSPGSLEDFLLRLISAEDPLLEQANRCLDAIPQEARRFRESYESKALLHTWLAWQEEPGNPAGLALEKRYLNAEHPAAAGFVRWLRRVFGIPCEAPQ